MAGEAARSSSSKLAGKYTGQWKSSGDAEQDAKQRLSKWLNSSPESSHLPLGKGACWKQYVRNKEGELDGFEWLFCREDGQTHKRPSKNKDKTWLCRQIKAHATVCYLTTYYSHKEQNNKQRIQLLLLYTLIWTQRQRWPDVPSHGGPVQSGE